MSESRRHPRKARRPKGQPGRPSVPPRHKGTRRFTVRLTEAQYRQLEAQASDAYLTVSQFVRAAIFKVRLRPPSIPRANLKYVAELNRLGNNLNQLLVLIYTNRAPLGLLSTLRQLQQTVDKVKHMLLAEWKEAEGDRPAEGESSHDE